MSGKNVRRTCLSAVSMFGGTIRCLFYASLIFALYPLSVIRLLNPLPVPTDLAIEGNRCGSYHPVCAYIHLLSVFN